MTSKNRIDLATDVANTLADNSTGSITPATLRQRLTDLSDSAFNKLSDTTVETTANKGIANGYAGLGSDGLVPATQLPAAAAGQPIRYDAPQSLTSAQQVQALNNIGLPGTVVDRQYAEYTTNADLTVAIPLDDTIPQVTEGTQILSVTTTPKSTTNRLRIRFEGWGGSNTAAVNMIAAIFVGGGANAVRATVSSTAGAAFFAPIVAEYEFVPGVTTSQTITVRVGSAATFRLNGLTSGRFLGGSAAATLIVEEIKA
jgi:hypothetical protein